MGTEKGSDFYTGEGYMKKGSFENNMLIYKQAYDLLKPIPKDTTIIDLGCGVGYFATLINSKYDYVGIDFSEKVIEKAIKLNQDKRFIISNLLDKSLKLIYTKECIYVCLEALEHIDNDIEVIKSIPSESTLIISLPNRDFTSHVRFFKNQNEIIERYNNIIDFDNCEWRIINTNEKKNAKVFMFKARRK